MTERPSPSRQQAERAFAETQTQFFARSKAVDEEKAIVRSRDEKTARLRQARLDREAGTRAAATTALIAKRANS